MQTLLLLISLLLHLVTFILIRNQSEKMGRIKEREEKSRQQAEETEELLSAYLYEIREENDRVIHQLQEKKSYGESPASSVAAFEESKGENLISYDKDEVDMDEEPVKEQHSIRPEKPVYFPPVDKAGEDNFEQSASSHAYSLFKQGNSIETIAKKLNCGKTEVDLMLKFYRE